MTTFERLRHAVRGALDSTATSGAARAGFAATGAVHLVLAGLALLLALGHQSGDTDQQGALRAIAGQPLGEVLLLGIAVGFLGFAGWRALQALAGYRDDDDGRVRTVKRAGSGVLAVAYLGVCGTVLRLALGGGGSDSDQQSRSATARLMDVPAGRLLVGAVGLGLFAAGGVLVWRGLHRSFTDQLRADLSGRVRVVVVTLGAAGWATRGAVLSLLGVFVVKAAVQHQAGEARGLDGALRTVAAEPYGRVLLGVAAAGLAAYGLFCWAEVRWRRT